MKGSFKMKTAKTFKDLEVVREEVTRVGADWEELFVKTGKAGQTETVVTVTRRHSNFEEVIMPYDPLFSEAVEATK